MSDQLRTVKKKEEMLQALEKNLSNVSIACKAVGISRNTHYTWLKEDPEYKERAQELVEHTLDFVENQMALMIKGAEITEEKAIPTKTGKVEIVKVKRQLPPSERLIEFVLKTKGKHRGYVERQEITGADGEAFAPPTILIHPGVQFPKLKKENEEEGRSAD